MQLLAPLTGSGLLFGGALGVGGYPAAYLGISIKGIGVAALYPSSDKKVSIQHGLGKIALGALGLFGYLALIGYPSGALVVFMAFADRFVRVPQPGPIGVQRAKWR